MHDVHVADYCIDVWLSRWHWVGRNYRDLKGIAPIQRAQVPDAAPVIHHHCYAEGIAVGSIAEQNVPIIPCQGQCPYTVDAELKTEGRIHIIVDAIGYSPGHESHRAGLTLDFDTEERHPGSWVPALHEVIKGHDRERVADLCHRIKGDRSSRVFLCEQRRGWSLGPSALSTSNYQNHVER